MIPAGNNKERLIGNFDLVAIGLFLIMIIIGWLNIYAAVYSEEHSSIFDMSRRYGVQLVWIGIALAMAFAIMLVDDRYYHILAYPLYWVSVVLLLAVALFGKEVNGARAWIEIGAFKVQPMEFVKVSTSLALARHMSAYDFSIHKFDSLLRVFAILLLPAAMIVLQNDLGSALIYGGYLVMLYREGLYGWIYFILALIVGLFIGSFMLNPLALLILLILLIVAAETLTNNRWRLKVIYLAALALLTMGIYFGLNILLARHISMYASLLVSLTVSIPAVLVYAYRERLRSVYSFLLVFMASLMFVSTVDYIFDNLVQEHQRRRVLDILGLESDLLGWGYNVNQSKIAIGSGGLFGKGFLHGTQTKYNFVPEQSTDFIFCTIGEEWGFVGSAVVVTLFGLLIFRLIRMGERQREPFGRIYCYCAASIIFTHVVINIGMAIGLLPVIGIPLPFFSYGGSSLIAFTMLLFIAIKLDSGKRDMERLI